MRVGFKKVLRGVGIAAAVLFGVLALLLGLFIYETEYRIAPIDSSSSPGGEYELLFQRVGDPDFPFGASHARFVLKKDGKTVIKYKFDVANDGKNLLPENWSVEWCETHALVTVNGEEQADALYALCFDGRVETEGLLPQCGK